MRPGRNKHISMTDYMRTAESTTFAVGGGDFLGPHEASKEGSCQFNVPGTDEFAAYSKSLDQRSLGYRFIKRTFDIVFSGCVLAVGVIPCAVLSVAISVDTKGSPIYSQIRVGRNGRPFRIFKFRTMVADSDDVEKYLSPEQLAQWHRERKVTNDPRITKLGALLRKTSIDEIPQFLNVLFGQISIVGPRAITYEELEQFGDDKVLLLSVTPGITGLWQTTLRNKATFENGMRQKIELDYAMHASLSLDAQIIVKTFSVMFGKKKTGK